MVRGKKHTAEQIVNLIDEHTRESLLVRPRRRAQNRAANQEWAFGQHLHLLERVEDFSVEELIAQHHLQSTIAITRLLARQSH